MVGDYMPDDLYIKMGQGPAKPVDDEALALDEYGLTNPNLHRRTNIEAIPVEPPEVAPREIENGIYSTNTYRARKYFIHDEESTTSEIP